VVRWPWSRKVVGYVLRRKSRGSGWEDVEEYPYPIAYEELYEELEEGYTYALFPILEGGKVDIDHPVWTRRKPRRRRREGQAEGGGEVDSEKVMRYFNKAVEPLETLADAFDKVTGVFQRLRNLAGGEGGGGGMDEDRLRQIIREEVGGRVSDTFLGVPTHMIEGKIPASELAKGIMYKNLIREIGVEVQSWIDYAAQKLGLAPPSQPRYDIQLPEPEQYMKEEGGEEGG